MPLTWPAPRAWLTLTTQVFGVIDVRPELGLGSGTSTAASGVQVRNRHSASSG